jgi:hypothetical protein
MEAARPLSTLVARAVGVASRSVARQHSMSTAEAAWLHTDPPTNLMIATTVLWFDEAGRLGAVPGRVRRLAAWRASTASARARSRARRSRLLTGRRTPTSTRAALPPRCAAGSARPPRAAGARRRPHRHAARPVPAAVGGLPPRRLRPAARWCCGSTHSIADGIALARVMLALTDGGEPDAGVAPAQGRRGRRLVGVIEPVAGGGSRRTRGRRDVAAPGARRRARRGGDRRWPTLASRRWRARIRPRR